MDVGHHPRPERFPRSVVEREPGHRLIERDVEPLPVGLQAVLRSVPRQGRVGDQRLFQLAQLPGAGDAFELRAPALPERFEGLLNPRQHECVVLPPDEVIGLREHHRDLRLGEKQESQDK